MALAVDQARIVVGETHDEEGCVRVVQLFQSLSQGICVSRHELSFDNGDEEVADDDRGKQGLNFVAVIEGMRPLNNPLPVVCSPLPIASNFASAL